MAYTLFDAIQLGGARDITDEIFDYLNYFDYSIDHVNDDDYDFCLDWIAHSVEAIKGDRDMIFCKISDFIDKNRKIFDAFLNVVYKDEWQPQNIEHISIDDEDFYDYYMAMFSDLINGNYSDKDYTLLAGLIRGKNDD